MYFFHKDIKAIIAHTAKELDISPYKVLYAISALFKFVRQVINNSTKNVKSSFKAVRINHLGLFRFNKRKYNMFKDKFKD